MTPYYFWLAFFFIVAYLIATDNSIATAIVLVCRIVKVNYEKMKWWLLHNPANPIVKWLMWRNALRLAKELEKELKDRV